MPLSRGYTMIRRDILKYIMIATGAGFTGSLAKNLIAGELPSATPSKSIFDANTSKMVAALSEIIIPKTDTPGAIEAGVPKFIEMMVADWYNDQERDIFFKGLVGLDTFCEGQFKKKFLKCNPEQQVTALKDAEQQAKSYHAMGLAGFGTDIQSKSIDRKTPFFNKIKELTVLGYYTSEVGAQQELAYDPMPMAYEGDYDFVKVGKQWSW